MIKVLAAGFAAIVLSVTAVQAQCPNLNAKPISGRIELDEGFTPDPAMRRVIAGGSQNLTRCRTNWKGWVSSSPDLQVYYRTPGTTRLTFYIESEMDTVLLINDPSSTWHYDDDSGQGLNGKIRFSRARQGRYDIWVGLFKEGRGKLPPVRIGITEED
jgi:hypothetical protein